MTQPSADPYWKQVVDSWSTLLAFVYVEGYLVANAHFARVEFTKAELLSGRYVSAGIILLAVCLVPVALGFLPWTLLLEKGPGRLQLTKAFGLLAVAALVYGVVISRITLPGAKPWDSPYLQFSLFLLGTAVFLALVVLLLKAQEDSTNASHWVQGFMTRVRTFMGSDARRRSDTGRRVSLMVAAVLCLVALAYDASRFGAMVYPPFTRSTVVVLRFW